MRTSLASTNPDPTMSSEFRTFVYGTRHSAYSQTYLERLLALGQRPTCIVSIDPSARNQASSRTLMLEGGEQFPLREGAWDGSAGSNCLLGLAARHRIPYLAVPDLQCPKLGMYLRQNPPGVIVATDGPIIRGSLFYLARYGILSVHAAHLPTFRGNWTTYFNLYHNVPLRVSAFIMQPWVDQGVLVGSRRVAVTRGMTLQQINEAALHSSVDLAVEVIGSMAAGTLSFRRQEPWEGHTFRGTALDGVLQPAMPGAQQQELAARLEAGQYGFYEDAQ